MSRWAHGRLALGKRAGGLLITLLIGTACGQPPAEQAGVQDSAAVRQAMQEHTETLLLIHFRLDSAATELARSEEQAQGGNYAAVDYHVAEARRHLDAADDAVLQLGQDLQQEFNLDTAGSNPP
jgi:thioredoxin-like negative regulator of GroEL